MVFDASLLARWETLVIAGILLLVAEVLLPGFYLLWFGLAALVTGGLMLVLPPLPWEFVLLTFALLSLVSCYIGNRLYRQKIVPQTPADGDVNQRLRRYIGHEYTAASDIDGSSGRVRIGDTTWLARLEKDGDRIEAGKRVRVIGAAGTTLIVAPMGDNRLAS
ncbi:NfeD family protein [Mangrovitalea sediminis]|uniref:NfeD family protein n=1 Tax=Mangrovitalea sediminis TaxID=1982043 RepID=UPI000BE5C1C5|nr:NfeD family protein [Mangrovitalea sediminis]